MDGLKKDSQVLVITTISERGDVSVWSLSKDFLPSNWVSYSPTVIDIGVFVGTIGLFAMGVLLFMRYIPMMAISELKVLLR